MDKYLYEDMVHDIKLEIQGCKDSMRKEIDDLVTVIKITQFLSGLLILAILLRT